MVYVKLFKDGDRMGIETDAIVERDFIDAFAGALADLIEKGTYDGDWSFQLDGWLLPFADIVGKLRGYKAEAVYERRTLFAGAPGGSPDELVALWRSHSTGIEPEGDE